MTQSKHFGKVDVEKNSYKYIIKIGIQAGSPKISDREHQPVCSYQSIGPTMHPARTNPRL